MAYGVHKVVSFVSSGLWDGCQWLLTVGTRAIGGIPDRGEGGVRLQEVGDDLRALHLQLVGAQTANKNGSRVSAAADSGIQACSGVLEILEGRVRLEALG